MRHSPFELEFRLASGLGRYGCPIVLCHEAALATSSIVRVNDALARSAVEHADCPDDGLIGFCLIAIKDRQFGLLDEGAARGPVRTVAHALGFIDADALLRSFVIGQVRYPLALISR